MGRSLVIVESPAKAKTINKYLGRNYSVKASYGHIMDLPRKVLGIDVKHGFEPTYEVNPDKEKVVTQLQKAAATADAVYLAGDPDREGEAICAHLAQVLSGPKLEFLTEEEKAAEAANGNGKNGKKKAKKPVKKVVARGKAVIARKNIYRVMFNEITSKAIKAAFEHPGEIDEKLVDAQQARRVLDRLVGYKISPLLWDKVRRGLSAGRVQTVALRLIVDREAGIRAFVPVEYWTLHALLAAGEPPTFEAKLTKFKGEDIEVHNQAEADAVVAAASNATWKVAAVTQKEKRRFAPPPFTTSKLQQAAYNRLRYTAKRTMGLAQRLYEGVELGQEGSVALITYMRTDSVRVSNDALDQVRGLIGSRYGQPYLPEKPNFFKSKKDAQDAHEAIRPTDAARTPEEVRPFLSEDMFKLYQLIWQRFVASQMVPAVFDQTSVDVTAGDYTFRASGSVQKFDGYLAVYQVSADDDEEGEADAAKALLPQLAEGDTLRLENLRPEQHFTEPPPRYTEATLVKELEEKGIGRPSTYASIISTIVDREYVTKDQGRFAPTMLGEKVSNLLVKSFEDIFDVGFTARMEEELDEIEEGKMPWKRAVKEFYVPFTADLERAKDEMESYKAGIPTGQKCEKCGQGELLERISRHGFFLGCSRYPDCDFIRDLSPELPPESEDGAAKVEMCDNCGREMVIKRGRWGMFLACTGYPDCKTTRRLKAGTRKALQPDELLDEKCPECGSQLVKKHGQYGEFTGCTAYPKCKFIRAKTMGIKCPKCETGELTERVARKGRRRVFYGCNKYPECDFTTPHLPIPEACPKCGAAFVVEKRGKFGAVRTCIKEGCDWEAAVPAGSPAAVPEPVGTAQS
ncbi:MAG TPA: type I DNA topoisomerase [Verrucomicrobiae bacterium]|nr:type I DNA topoisomerase [Verrucomicrobiae bacterium]